MSTAIRSMAVCVCEHCRRTFSIRADRRNQRFCSIQCANAQNGPPQFETSPEPRSKKVRANALINMRVRRGKLQRPTACEWCGAERKLDGHHPDYAKPDEVWWLCRSCHMRVHHGTITLPEKKEARAPSTRLEPTATEHGTSENCRRWELNPPANPN